VRGMSAAIQQAAEGMKLFQATQGTAAEVDLAAAEKYKNEMDERIAALEDEAARLTGKDNKKERAAKGKEASELKAEPQYVDACKVVKGMEPKFGHFVTKAAIVPMVETKSDAKPAAKEDEAKKKEKETKPKKEEKEAGLTAAEAKELEKLKQDIMERKAILKEQGMSGGQQNKDPEVVKMVERMSALKEKECPGSTAKESKKDTKKSRAPLSAEEQKEMAKHQGENEAYKHNLKVEFGYSNKEIKADPDLVEMEGRLAAFEKREG